MVANVLPELRVRDAVLGALVRIEAGLDAQEALHRAIRPDWSRRDRAFANDLIYGVTRYRRTLDSYIDEVSSTKSQRQSPLVRNALRLALYQIRYQDSVPARAAVHTTVALIRRRVHDGAARFVNAVLRQHLRLHPEHEPAEYPTPADASVAQQLAIRHSHPDWLVERWLQRYGKSDTEKLLEWNNRPASITLRVNQRKVSTDQAVETLVKRGWNVERGRWLPEALLMPHGFTFVDLDGVLASWFQVQDESSMLVVYALAPEPDWTVLDMAAAPGGKATHIAEKLSPNGKLIANDVSTERLEYVRQNMERLQLDHVPVEYMQADGRALARKWRDSARKPVDAVLLDAPCTGTGVLRRRVDARWRKELQGLRSLVRLQAELLDQAAQLVRPGGVLVYSTCSLEPEENEQQVEKFLARHREFRRSSLQGLIPEQLAVEGVATNELQLFPPHHQTDGFFIARMVRI